MAGAAAEAGAASLERLEGLAHEVLRLRSLRRRHGELRAELAQAEVRLRRLSAHSVLQFHSYLEKQMSAPSAARAVQPAISELLEGLCAAGGPAPGAPEDELPHLGRLALLDQARQLLRDAHELTGRLRSLPPMCPAEARERAPRLLKTSYTRVQEPEVDKCCETLCAWLAAFYAYSAVAEQVQPVALELARQEARLRQLAQTRTRATLSPSRTPPPPPPLGRTLSRTDAPAPQLSPAAASGRSARVGGALRCRRSAAERAAREPPPAAAASGADGPASLDDDAASPRPRPPPRPAEKRRPAPSLRSQPPPAAPRATDGAASPRPRPPPQPAEKRWPGPPGQQLAPPPASTLLQSMHASRSGSAPAHKALGRAAAVKGLGLVERLAGPADISA